AAQLVKNKKFWLCIATAALFPIAILVLLLGLLVSIFTSFSYDMNTNLNDYAAAVTAVAAKNDITNYLSPYLVKAIDSCDNELFSSASQLEAFILNNFVQTTIEETENIDGTKKRVVKHRYYSTSEMFSIVQNAPFNLSENDIQLICELSLEPLGDFPTDNIPITPGEMSNPLVGWVSSPYGSRTDPFTGAMTFHNGMDIVAVNWHSSVHAIYNGVVHSTGTHKSYGNWIILEHKKDDKTFYTFYAHLSKISVFSGQTILSGQVIGNEGGQPKEDENAGDSTGHHLHFEVRLTPQSSSHTNPLAYIVGY
ncbi:MAG: M23 family metallopeptidase, partial [Oscillospiraceae bacterium]